MAWLRGAFVVALLAALTGCSAGDRVSLDGDAHSSIEAQRRAVALLDQVFLAGSVRVEPPEPLLGTSTPDDFVTQARWFTVLGSPETVVDRLRHRPPSGLENATDQYESSAPVTSSSASFKPAGRASSSMQAVDVVATDAGAGRAFVQVKAAVGWIGPRTTLETIPPVVTEARLAIGYGDDTESGLQLQQSVSPRQMALLSKALASLPTTSRSEYALCSAPDVALVQLTAHYGGHAAVFDIEVGGCNEVDVNVDGREQPLLDHDQPVVRVVAQILGVSLPVL